MDRWRRSNGAALAGAGLAFVGLTCFGLGCASNQQTASSGQVSALLLTPTATPSPLPITRTPTPVLPTPFPCPQATPEPFWVDPVVSPTDQLTQVVTVHIGRGERVKVTTNAGVFEVTGSFNATNIVGRSLPAQVEVKLLPGMTNQVEVAAWVEVANQGACRYGGYALTTTRDKNGRPLAIDQVSR